MYPPIDLAGQRFGKLVVMSRAENDKFGETRWNCVCDCGKHSTVNSSNLRKGRQKSCGCLRHLSPINKTHGESANGKSGRSRLYGIWTNMKNRCNNPNNHAFKDYGGRGIKVCNEWNENYELFRDWAICNGYSEKLSIDRIGNDKGYSPNNCRWETKQVQANNRRSSRFILVNGERVTTAEAARIQGIDYHLFMKRLYKEAC